MALRPAASFYILIDSIIERSTRASAKLGQERSSDTVRGANSAAGAWMVYFAVAVDLFADGLLIGASSSVSFSLALVLAVGQVTADIPEGFATIANFKDKGVPRARRLLLGASFVIPVLLGAALSYFLLRGSGEALQLTALAFIGGMLLIAATEEVIGEAHEAYGPSNGGMVSIVAGFVLFALVASYFEA